MFMYINNCHLPNRHNFQEFKNNQPWWLATSNFKTNYILIYVSNLDHQPFVNDLHKISIKLQVPQAMIKKTSIELLHAFTDSVFQFMDHPSLPSQVIYSI